MILYFFNAMDNIGYYLRLNPIDRFKGVKVIILLFANILPLMASFDSPD